MCLMCSGCGRCFGEKAGLNRRKCLCCGTEVPDDEMYCPKCGLYVMPKAGSKLKRKPKPPAEVARTESA